MITKAETRETWTCDTCGNQWSHDPIFIGTLLAPGWCMVIWMAPKSGDKPVPDMHFCSFDCLRKWVTSSKD